MPEPFSLFAESWFVPAVQSLAVVVQTIGILIALAFSTSQYVRTRRADLAAQYLEVDKRFTDYLKACMEYDSPPLPYEPDFVATFTQSGATVKELLLYDMLFSLWEAAFLQRRHDERQFAGWQQQMVSYFRLNPRLVGAWEHSAHLWDRRFAGFVRQSILPRALA